MFKTLFGPKEPKATFVRSMEEMRLKTHANTAWGLGSTDRWDADLELGTIKFSNADGYTVTAPVQVIGTYDSTWSEWLWGWDHPSVGQALAQDARLAREFGRRHKLEQFTARKVLCTEEDAWRFTAVALHLSGAAGSYRGPSGTTFIFMTFGEVKISVAP